MGLPPSLPLLPPSWWDTGAGAIPGRLGTVGAAARRPGSSPLPSLTWSPRVCCPEPPRCQGTRTCCHEGVYGASARRCLLEIAGGGGRGGILRWCWAGNRVPGARPRRELNQAPACQRGGWRPPAAAGQLGMSPGCAAVPRLLEHCGCCWKSVLTPRKGAAGVMGVWGGCGGVLGDGVPLPSPCPVVGAHPSPVLGYGVNPFCS